MCWRLLPSRLRDEAELRLLMSLPLRGAGSCLFCPEGAGIFGAFVALTGAARSCGLRCHRPPEVTRLRAYNSDPAGPGQSPWLPGWAGSLQIAGAVRSGLDAGGLPDPVLLGRSAKP